MSKQRIGVGVVVLLVAIVVAFWLSTGGWSAIRQASASGSGPGGQATNVVSAFTSAAAPQPRATTAFQPGIVDRPEVSMRVANVLRVRTSWGGVVNGRQTMVYAGTDVKNPGNGMIMVYTGTLTSGSQLEPKEGVSVPDTETFVIAAADGTILTVVDGHGHTRQYDVATRQFR